MVEGDEPFKRPGVVPFKWEIRPGVPKIRNPQPPDDPSLLHPPNNLPPLRLKPFSSSSSLSNFKNRHISPFALPLSFKLNSPPSGPPPQYFPSSSPLARLKSGASCFPFGLKKSKSGDVKKKADSTSSESDNFYEYESMFTRRPEDSSEGSISMTWGSSLLDVVRRVNQI